jgi:hypothetical protein
VTAPGRYSGLARLVYTTSDGRQIPYLSRRLLPPMAAPGTTAGHVVVVGERIDTIAAVELGDATQSWRLADVNPTIFPTDLATPGRVVAVPRVGGGYGA